MIKVRFFPWWTTSEDFHHRVRREFIGNHFNHPSVTLTHNDDYDYAIVCCYTKEQLKTDKDHTIYFFMEPNWSVNWDREAYKKSSRVFVTDKELYGNYDEYIEHKNFMPYGGKGFDVAYNIDDILNYSNTNKNKNISSIITNREASPLDGRTEGNLYMERTRFVADLMRAGLDFDAYGFFWENSDIKCSQNKGTLCSMQKVLATEPYRFSLAIENTSEKNYITEKFYDPVYYNCVPIYFGAPNIAEQPDIGNIPIVLKDIRDISNFDENLNILKSLDDNIYKEKIKGIIELKKKLFESPEHSMWQRVIHEVTK